MTRIKGNGRETTPRRANIGIPAAGDGDVPFNAELRDLVHRQLELLGEDTDREGLQRTPERVAKSLAWLTRGYQTCVEDVVGQVVKLVREAQK